MCTKSQIPFLIDNKDAGVHFSTYDAISLKSEDGKDVLFSYDGKQMKIQVNGKSIDCSGCSYDS